LLAAPAGVLDVVIDAAPAGRLMTVKATCRPPVPRQAAPRLAQSASRFSFSPDGASWHQV